MDIFIAVNWEEVEKETEEMKPQWFEKDAIPFDLMWDDSKYWVGKILNEEKIKGEFLFDENLKVCEFELTQIT